MAYVLGLDLNPEIREYLKEFLERGKEQFREVNWLPPEQLIVALRFLGDLAENDLKRIRRTVADISAEIAPFDFGLGRGGCFPPNDPPRSIWLAVESDNDMLRRLRSAIEKGFTVPGTKSQEILPHIVLGRVPGKTVQGNLRRFAETISAKPLKCMASELVLFASRPGKSGTEYHPLHRLSFLASVH